MKKELGARPRASLHAVSFFDAGSWSISNHSIFCKAKQVRLVRVNVQFGQMVTSYQRQCNKGEGGLQGSVIKAGRVDVEQFYCPQRKTVGFTRIRMATTQPEFSHRNPAKGKIKVDNNDHENN